jgi:2'-5' RNA ligase
MQDHWWWRPGWEVGRRLLTFHLTFADQPDLCAAAEPYRDAVRPLGIFDDVPDRWLHLTTQDVAFLDEVAPREIDDIIDAVQARLSNLKPVTIDVRPAEVGTEGVYLPIVTSRELESLRRAIRSGITDAGRTPPGSDDDFWPHVSVAYCRASAPDEPVLAAVGSVPAQQVPVVIRHVDLIVLSRDRHLYEWLSVASLSLTG